MQTATVSPLGGLVAKQQPQRDALAQQVEQFLASHQVDHIDYGVSGDMCKRKNVRNQRSLAQRQQRVPKPANYRAY